MPAAAEVESATAAAVAALTEVPSTGVELLAQFRVLEHSVGLVYILHHVVGVDFLLGRVGLAPVWVPKSHFLAIRFRYLF